MRKLPPKNWKFKILSIATAASYFHSMMVQLKALKDPERRTRPNPQQKLYTPSINSKLNNYLRNHTFPRSLYSFIDSVGHANLFPQNSQRFINLLSSRNFGCGTEIITAMTSELSSENQNLTVRKHQ